VNALALVNKLLETDVPPEDDPSTLRDYYAGDPSKVLAGALRDELVERGWRNIQIQKPDEPQGLEWIVTAGFIDEAYRQRWLVAGARVAPTPVDSIQLRGRLVQSFKAACKRIKAHAGITLMSLEPAHEAYDLHTGYDDIEDDPGDWRVTLELIWKPGTFLPGFWGKASQAIGYEDKPYQQTAQPAPAPRKPVRSLLTPEQQDAADERHRTAMADLKARAHKSSKDFDQNLERWRREGGPFPDYLL